MRVLCILRLVSSAMALVACTMAQEAQDIDLKCDEDNMNANHRRNAGSAVTGNIGLGATLAFVFDTTESMHDDLAQFREVANEIIDEAVKSAHIHNFILMPFNDVDSGGMDGPLTVTTDPVVFHAALKDITVGGGGDCPEDSLEGIIQALEAVQPNSFVYVFTDASAEHPHKKDKVIHLIHEKQAQVTFLLTPDTDCLQDDTDTTYNIISGTSSGQVFNIDRKNITKILDHVKSSLEEKKVNLLSVQWSSGLNIYKVLVDNTMKVLTVSATGEYTVIRVFGPDNELVTMDESVFLKYVNIDRLINPKPGIYDISVDSKDRYTEVRVTGDSLLSFEQGFFREQTANFTETSRRPIIWETTYVMVKPKGLTDFGDMYRIQLIILGREANIIYDFPLKLIPGSDAIYSGTSFTAPSVTFNVKIFGCTLSGLKFERISATAIKPMRKQDLK